MTFCPLWSRGQCLSWREKTQSSFNDVSKLGTRAYVAYSRSDGGRGDRERKEFSAIVYIPLTLVLPSWAIFVRFQCLGLSSTNSGTELPTWRAGANTLSKSVPGVWKQSFILDFLFLSSDRTVVEKSSVLFILLKELTELLHFLLSFLPSVMRTSSC